MSTSDLDPQLSYNIHAALEEVMHDEEHPAILNRWILMSEQIYEGGSSVSYITSPTLSTWEVLGMVNATKIVAENHLLDLYDDDDDDEG